MQGLVLCNEFRGNNGLVRSVELLYRRLWADINKLEVLLIELAKTF